MDDSFVGPANLSSNRSSKGKKSSEEEKGFSFSSLFNCRASLNCDKSKLGEKGIDFRGCTVKKRVDIKENSSPRAERTSKKSKSSDGSEASARSGSQRSSRSPSPAPTERSSASTLRSRPSSAGSSRTAQASPAPEVQRPITEAPAAPDLTLASVEVAIQQQQKPKKGIVRRAKDAIENTFFSLFHVISRYFI